MYACGKNYSAGLGKKTKTRRRRRGASANKKKVRRAETQTHIHTEKTKHRPACQTSPPSTNNSASAIFASAAF
jgi:hypothetical protein